MSEGIKKFEELARTDAAFREKLKAAMEKYSGEESEKAVFENVLVPLAAEYGISATYDEFRAYLEGISDQEMSSDEVKQVAGGVTKGGGANACFIVGLGGGAVYSDENGGTVCLGVGIGDAAEACVTKGYGF